MFFTDESTRRRRLTTNLTQQLWFIHGCDKCDGCKLRAQATYSQLDGDRQPEPA